MEQVIEAIHVANEQSVETAIHHKMKNKRDIARSILKSIVINGKEVSEEDFRHLYKAAHPNGMNQFTIQSRSGLKSSDSPYIFKDNLLNQCSKFHTDHKSEADDIISRVFSCYGTKLA